MASQLTASLVDVPSVSGDEQRLGRRGRGGAAWLRRLEVERDGNVVLARTDSAGRSASSSPDTSTPCRSPTTCRRTWRRRGLLRLRHVGHEVGRGGALRAGDLVGDRRLEPAST